MHAFRIRAIVFGLAALYTLATESVAQETDIPVRRFIAEPDWLEGVMGLAGNPGAGQDSQYGPQHGRYSFGANLNLDSTSRTTEDPFGGQSDSSNTVGALQVSGSYYSADLIHEFGGFLLFNATGSSASGTESTSSVFGLSGYYRYNIPIEANAKFFFGGEMGLTTSAVDYGTGSLTTTEFVLGFPIGLKYFVDTNVSLDSTLKFNLGVGGDDAANSTTTTGVGLFFGFSIYV